MLYLKLNVPLSSAARRESERIRPDELNLSDAPPSPAPDLCLSPLLGSESDFLPILHRRCCLSTLPRRSTLSVTRKPTEGAWMDVRDGTYPRRSKSKKARLARSERPDRRHADRQNQARITVPARVPGLLSLGPLRSQSLLAYGRSSCDSVYSHLGKCRILIP